VSGVRRRFLQVGLAAGLSGLSSAWSQPLSAIEGEWSGVLAAGGTQLRLRLVIGPGEQATLFSLDQGGQAIVADQVAISDGSVRLRFPSVRGRFEGSLRGETLTGTWTQGAEVPLQLVRGAALVPVEALSSSRLFALREQSGAPGIAAAAQHRNGRSLALVDGLRQIHAAAPIATDDQWHVGSITKSMTALLVARLAEAGVVAWDTPLYEMLGQAVPDMLGAYRTVTFRHLLSHRSGLAANIPMDQFVRFPRTEVDARVSRVAYARIALGAAPAVPLEAHFEYSNSGYIVAGAVLEAVTGEPWEVLIQRHVFDVLGLASAGFGAPGRPGALDQPVGHAQGLLQLRAYPPGGPVTDNPAVLGPAGRVHISLSDLLVYGGVHRDRTSYLQPAGWDMLHTPPFGGDYAMGLVRTADGSLWHNGSNTLFYAELLIDPAGGRVAAAAANSGALERVQPAVHSAVTQAMVAVG
jgi:CubicO group peptidase (beta-lactamase class C family)